jgi:hypothetical protein
LELTVSLVVFLRGVNVGGHRTFRPSILAKGLSDYGVVNVGAAGTFVVRKPGSKTKFRAAVETLSIRSGLPLRMNCNTSHIVAAAFRAKEVCS